VEKLHCVNKEKDPPENCGIKSGYSNRIIMIISLFNRCYCKL